jgi:type III restriction enzyme
VVIHVNKLKEGWDVRNLYTIVPLRASASDILTEQTLGRGLRLP